MVSKLLVCKCIDSNPVVLSTIFMYIILMFHVFCLFFFLFQGDMIELGT